MGNGFPTSKFFRIINEDTGLCLAAAPGGTTHGAQEARDRWTGETGYIPYTHTNDQVLVVSKPQGGRGEIWFFDDRENGYREKFWRLINVNRDIRSAFVLHVGPLDGSSQPVELGLQGWGEKGTTQWKASMGMFWPGSHDDKAVTLLADGNSNYRAVVMARDADTPNQRWRFDEVELTGESAPVRKKGIYEYEPAETRGDPLKWREAM
jgi:hypothetical protein